MYREHIRNLYHMGGRRFPCEYPSAKSGDDFYSYTDDRDTTRILLGYAPYGRSIIDGMWESVYVMRLTVYKMIADIEKSYAEICTTGFSGSIEDYKEMLYDYWIELVYNNRKQDAMELENAFQNQGNNYLEAKGVPKFVIEQMTSDVDFQTVRQTLFNIQANRRNFESTNLLLATSTISHGVDEDSFKQIVLNGRNWSLFFEDTFVRPEEINLAGGKDPKTEWILRLNTINNKLLKDSYSVPVDEYSYVKSIYEWIMGILVF